MATYGYVRISTAKQNIERQIRNILASYPDAKITKEVFTGKKFQGRKELDKLLKKVKQGDTIVFDSVSRMSRNAEEGVQLYMDLFDREINLIFLKERYIDTSVYKTAVEQTIGSTGNEIADIYVEATNRVIKLLAEKQIVKAFEQAQKEVDDLSERTKEGIETARRHGKQIGHQAGVGIVTKKSIRAKELIKKHNRTFGGSLTNEETWKMIGISKTSFYKYKMELEVELETEVK